MKQIDFSLVANLETPRLILRKLQAKDVTQIFNMRNNAVVNKYLDRAASATIPEALEFINQINKGIEVNKWLYWGITFKDAAEVIGTICIWNIDTEKNVAEVGYELLPEHHGKGVMQEALAHIIAVAFDVLKLKGLHACTHVDNQPSKRLLEKNNFVQQHDKSSAASPEVFYFLHKRDKALYSSFT